MKNHIKWLGLIVLVTVIGLSFVACGGSEPEKTISITGIPAEYLTATRRYNIFVSGTDGKIVAMGSGQFSASTVTCDLVTVLNNDNGSFNPTQNRWTGKGTFRVGLTIYLDGSNKYGNVQAIRITGAVTTIPFSQFQ
jgi:hypothetical protein